MEASEKVAILLSDRPQPVFRAIIGDSAARSAAVRRGGLESVLIHKTPSQESPRLIPALAVR